MAFVVTALPRVTGVDHDADWSFTSFEVRQSQDLTQWRGTARGRNIIVIHLESTAASHLRSYGAVEDPMPNLTELAAQAIVVENAYTVDAETIKSLVAVQCSIEPAVDTDAERCEHLPGPTLASLLSTAGYRTGLYHSGRFRYLGMTEVLRNRGYQSWRMQAISRAAMNRVSVSMKS